MSLNSPDKQYLCRLWDVIWDSSELHLNKYKDEFDFLLVFDHTANMVVVLHVSNLKEQVFGNYILYVAIFDIYLYSDWTVSEPLYQY